MSIDKAISVIRFGAGTQLRISPDGAWIASTVCDPSRVVVDRDDDGWRFARGVGSAYGAEGCDVWVHSLKGHGNRNVSGARGSSWAPSWSPDGNRLAFYSDRDGQPNVWLWETKAGEMHKASEITTFTAVMTESPVWASNSTLIVKAKSQSLESRGQKQNVEVYRSPREIVPGTATYDSDEWNNLLWGEANRGDLVAIDLHDGGTHRLLKDLVTYRYAISPDGRQLAFLDGRLADLPKLRPTTLGVLEISTGKMIARIDNIREFGYGAPGHTFSWSPDGKSLVFLSLELARVSPRENAPAGARAPYDEPAFETSVNIYRIQDGSRLRLSGTAGGMSSSVPLWGDNGRDVYFISNGRIWNGSLETFSVKPVALSGGLEGITIVDRGDGRRTFPKKTGELLIGGRSKVKDSFVLEQVSVSAVKRRALFSCERANSIQEFVVSPSAADLVLMRGSSSEPSDLWQANTRSCSSRRMTTLNPGFRSSELGSSETIDYKTNDGTTLGASLWLPPSHKAGDHHPLVVWVYPGAFPSHTGSTTFPEPFLNLHLLTTRGFAVLFPDIPISGGHPIDDLMKAVVPAVDTVVAKGVADADRLAVMGHSYGGYAALAVITRTTRFKAAIVAAGFGDLIGIHRYVAGAVEEQSYGGMGGPPWEFPERYLEGSPIFRLDDIQTPLLIQVGTADFGLLPFSDQVFVEMRRLRKPVTYIRYSGEEHTLHEPRNLIDYWQRVIAFLSDALDVNVLP